ncbi:MAG: hypothetical protein R6V83_10570 [Candidatus Thorarchaeota archaeon]
MSRGRLRGSILVLGVVLLVISFLPCSLVYNLGSVEEGSYVGYPFQCVTNPHIAIDVRFENTISFYIVSLEDSFRFIDGEPLENLTMLFSIEDIRKYSGTPELGAPGQYVIFITTSNLEGLTSYTLSVSVNLPHLWIFTIGLTFLALGVLVHISPLLRTVLWKK